MLMKKLILFFLLFLSGISVYANSFFHRDGINNITSKGKFFITDSKSFEIPEENNFKEVDKDDFQTGYTEKVVWLKFNIVNSLSNRTDFIFFLNTALSGEVQFFIEQDGKIIKTIKSGSVIPFKKREIQSFFPAIDLNLNFNESVNVYVRRVGYHNFNTRFLISDTISFQREFERRRFFSAFFIGILFALLVYNLFVGVFNREKVYLLYSLNIIVMGATGLNICGVLDYIFDYPVSQYLFVFSSLAVATSLSFANVFLNVSRNFKRAFRYSGYLICVLMFFSLIYFLTPISFRYFLGVPIDLIILAVLIYFIVISILLIRRDVLLAYFYLASWFFLITGAMIWLGAYIGLLPSNSITQHSLLLGNAAEMLTLSLALAFKMNVLKNEKFLAEQRAADKDRYRLLVRVLVHDIANPLTLILNNSSKALRKMEYDFEVFNSIKKASLIIKDIIENVNNEENVVNKQNEVSTSLKDALNESFFIFKSRLEEKNIDLKINLDVNDVFVVGDKTTIVNNIINNVLSNALKFSPHNSSIYITTSKSMDNIYLSILDSGEGLSAEDIKYVSKYQRLKVKEGTGGEIGRGFGLDLIFSYIKKFDGDIIFESCKSNTDIPIGTRVTIVFKLS